VAQLAKSLAGRPSIASSVESRRPIAEHSVTVKSAVCRSAEAATTVDAVLRD
jgi:hypothetical protein